MIRSIISFLTIFVCNSVFAQINMTREQTVAFANYLASTNQYDLAAREYQRVLFFDPTDTVALHGVFSAFCNMGEPDQALQLYIKYANNPLLTPKFASKYFSTLADKGDYSKALAVIDGKKDIENYHFYKTVFTALGGNWKQAREYCDTLKSGENAMLLASIIKRESEQKYKSPFLGALFSTFLPGSGKLYAKRAKDGAVAFLMVGTSALVAQRAFAKQGGGEAYPWMLGSLTAGYYVGNVYGGSKAVKQYNAKIELKYINEIKELLHTLH